MKTELVISCSSKEALEEQCCKYFFSVIKIEGEKLLNKSGTGEIKNFRVVQKGKHFRLERILKGYIYGSEIFKPTII